MSQEARGTFCAAITCDFVYRTGADLRILRKNCGRFAGSGPRGSIMYLQVVRLIFALPIIRLCTRMVRRAPMLHRDNHPVFGPGWLPREGEPLCPPTKTAAVKVCWTGVWQRATFDVRGEQAKEWLERGVILLRGKMRTHAGQLLHPRGSPCRGITGT